jgi:hypothetical protein
MIEYQRGERLLRVEYFGTGDSELEARIIDAVGKRPKHGYRNAQLGADHEQRSSVVFEIEPDEVEAIKQRLNAL